MYGPYLYDPVVVACSEARYTNIELLLWLWCRANMISFNLCCLLIILHFLVLYTLQKNTKALKKPSNAASTDKMPVLLDSLRDASPDEEFARLKVCKRL